MPALPKKIRRRRAEGDISIEQTRDLAAAAAMFEQAGISARPPIDVSACILMGYCGNDPAGIVCLETQVDMALVLWLFVCEPMRKRGLGMALIDAARSAARTRGVRSLYAIAPRTGEYLTRFGFTHVSPAEVAARFGSAAPGLKCLGEERVSYFLDISRDGLIER